MKRTHKMRNRPFTKIQINIIVVADKRGGLHGFQFGSIELPNFQNFATSTK